MGELFGRDQVDTVSGPNPDDTSNYAEHVVHARGKRTRFTSVSTSRDAIRDFGNQLWKLVQPKVTDDGHVVVTHEQLLQELRDLLHGDDERASELAARALPRSIRRREALVDWRYKTDGIERKDRISWAERYVREYFTRC
jgi:hypothetical protein